MINFIYQISNLSHCLSFCAIHLLFSNLTWHDLIIQAVRFLILEVYNTGGIGKNIRHNFQPLVLCVIYSLYKQYCD